MLLLATAVAAQPQLSVQGEPYFDGDMTLSVVDASSVGELVWLAVGLNPLPLDAPIVTGKGPWYIGTLTHSLLLGSVPANGEFLLPFMMPSEMPALVGIPIVLQGFVNGLLSNPATLPLDQPYLEPANAQVFASPEPSIGADFGDRVAIGDLNGDGSGDLVVGAWFEDYLGIEKSGRVYVFWGPDFLSYLALNPQAPHPAGELGASVTIADFNGDGIDDLIVGEGSGYPLSPPGPGHLHYYAGGASFSSTPQFSIASSGTGLEASSYGRFIATGDFNADTFVDVAVGLPNAQVGLLKQAGRIDVFWGPGYSSPTGIVSPDPGQGDHFGSSLSTGDVDGDGVHDLVEGSGRDDVAGIQNAGSVHVYSGPTLTLVATLYSPIPATPLARFGDDIHVADLDANGIAEILTKDDLDNVFIFWDASASNVQVLPKPPDSSVNPFGDTSYGSRLDSADVNGDGLLDLLIGDMFEGLLACPTSSGGTLFAALGPYYSTFHVLHDSQPECGNLFGWYFTTGQLDDDQPLELVVGSMTADDGGLQNSGHVTVFDLD